MGTVVNRTVQALTFTALATALINDLAANGFSVIYVNQGGTAPGSMTATKATLEAGSSVDPLNALYPWRIQIDGSVASFCYLYVGNPFTLPASGVSTGSTQLTLANTAILNGSTFAPDFDLYITARGVAILTKVANQVSGYFSLVVIQRPSNKDTGTVLTTKRMPVMCFYVLPAAIPVSCYSVIVRENDGTAPTAIRTFTDMSVNTHTNVIPLNAAYAPPLLDADGNYVIFPVGGIRGSQGIYLEELDMLMWANQSGFNTGQQVSIVAYGGTRQYTCIPARALGQDVRFMLLSGGTGF